MSSQLSVITAPRDVDNDERNLWEEDLSSLLSNPNPILFKSYVGYPISFLIKVKDSNRKRLLENIVIAYGGDTVSNECDVTVWTAVLFEERPNRFFKRPHFKIDYIIDCVKRNELLDITDYKHCKKYFEGSHTDSCMNVIFWRSEEFPPTGKIVTEESATKTSASGDPSKATTSKPASECSSIDDDFCSFSVVSTKSSLKRTRAPYTLFEKEAIIKFLVANNRYNNLKGNSVWKTMEVRNVCPIRTYQSLKEHFSKVIIHELDRFSFLTDKQKESFRKGFFH